VFDENYILKDAGAMRVPDNAGFDPGMEIAVTPKQIAFINPIRPQQKGYIYIWVSNECENTKVWFDDLKITHRSRRVTQAIDYYAYGSVLREQKTPEELTYRYKYQGQFAEKDEETGWSHFELREYDPIIGRWLVPDPMRQYWSPYVAYGNNPVNIVDRRGGEGDPVNGQLNEAGTHQWGLNATTGEYGWSEIMQSITITPQTFPSNFIFHAQDATRPNQPNKFATKKYEELQKSRADMINFVSSDGNSSGGNIFGSGGIAKYQVNIDDLMLAFGVNKNTAGDGENLLDALNVHERNKATALRIMGISGGWTHIGTYYDPHDTDTGMLATRMGGANFRRGRMIF